MATIQLHHLALEAFIVVIPRSGIPMGVIDVEMAPVPARKALPLELFHVPSGWLTAVRLPPTLYHAVGERQPVGSNIGQRAAFPGILRAPSRCLQKTFGDVREVRLVKFQHFC